MTRSGYYDELRFVIVLNFSFSFTPTKTFEEKQQRILRLTKLGKTTHLECVPFILFVQIIECLHSSLNEGKRNSPNPYYGLLNPNKHM